MEPARTDRQVEDQHVREHPFGNALGPLREKQILSPRAGRFAHHPAYTWHE
jgi:hypothetical protein